MDWMKKRPAEFLQLGDVIYSDEFKILLSPPTGYLPAGEWIVAELLPGKPFNQPLRLQSKADFFPLDIKEISPLRTQTFTMAGKICRNQ
jgi:hypothetical protein